MRIRLVPWREWRLRSKLTLVLVLLGILPLTVVALYNDVSTRRALLAQTHGRNLHHAKATAEAIDRYLAERLGDVRLVGGLPVPLRYLADPHDTAGWRDTTAILYLVRDIYGYDSVFIVDPLGTVLAASDERLVGRSYFLAPAFRSAIAGKTSLDGPRYDAEDGQVFVTFSSPAQSAEDPILGAVMARITMTPLASIVARDSDTVGPGTFGVLWDETGIRLVHGRLPELEYTPFAPLDPSYASVLIAEGRFGPRTEELVRAASTSTDLMERSRLLLYDRTADPHVHLRATDVGPVHAAITPLMGVRWLYGVFTPEAAVLAPVEAETRRSLLTALYAGLVATAVALTLARWLARPLGSVTATAVAIAAGDLNRRVGLHQNDETGRLAAAFDAMADAIAERDAQLRTHAGQLERAVDELAHEVAERKHAEERLRQHAARVESLARISATLADAGLRYERVLDLIARNISETVGDTCVITIISDDREHLDVVSVADTIPEATVVARQMFASVSQRVGEGITGRVAQTGEPALIPVVPQDSIRATIKPDYLPWLERYGMHSLLIVPLRVGGQIIGTLGVSRHSAGQPYSTDDQAWLQSLADRAALVITVARLHAESWRRAQDLEAANKELEAFSYSVSHDLRAPLRAIDGFSRILLEEHASSLPPDAQRYLSSVRRNAEHMDQLITDLLAFSRLSRQPLNKQTVDPTPLVRGALDDLRAEQEGRRVEVVIGDLPPCQADPTLLRQVFVNLLSNALKFTRRREVARIEVGSERDGERWVYYVKDNGVGFDMQYADKLFGVFQRLHRAEEYEGTGVGLAIVQRIVHRHGGRVWIESEVDKGTVVRFQI